MKSMKIIIALLALFAAVFAATIAVEVNTYCDHSFKAESAGNIPAGNYVQIASWGNYVKVKLPDGKEGYLWNNQAVLDGDKVIGVGGTLVAGPSIKTEKLACVMPGTVVKIISTNIEWYQVEFDGVKRWVPSIRFK